MSNLEIYKTMYYYELDSKEKVNSRISIPLAISTFLIGGLGYFIKKIIEMPNKAWVGCYFAFLALYCIAVIATILCTLFSYFGYSYKYVQASDLRKYELEIEKYYEENYEEYFKEKGAKDKLQEKDFENSLIERYIQATEINMSLNTKKLFYFRATGWTTMLCAITGFILFMFLVVNKLI